MANGSGQGVLAVAGLTEVSKELKDLIGQIEDGYEVDRNAIESIRVQIDALRNAAPKKL